MILFYMMVLIITGLIIYIVSGIVDIVKDKSYYNI